MRLISWNLAGRAGEKLENQIRKVGRQKPDLVALQEVRRRTVKKWRESLEGQGLCHIEDTLDQLPPGRRNIVLVASRWPLTRLPSLDVRYAERFLSVMVQREEHDRPTELHVAHLPPGSTHPEEKIETFEAMYRRLVRPMSSYRILCGDFNSPQIERRTGEVLTWAQYPSGELGFRGRDERWDAAERSVLKGLEPFDLKDVFRALNGYEKNPKTWVPGGRDPGIRRYDHVLASAGLNASSFEYLHEWRKSKSSDHSGVKVEFRPQP